MELISRCILVLVVIANSLSAQTNDHAIKQIDSVFSKYNSTTPGVAVAVVKDGKLIFKKGYGMANLEYDVANSPKTIFHIASLSKQFTAFAIYLLEKQGKISFDDDVRKYIPELPVYDKPITIKHLCAHTSGIKDQWSLLTLAGWRMDDVITTEQILKITSKYKELNFAPGSQFQYSNTGFTLLAEIVKRVSGQSFSAFTKAYIFDPLKMDNTQFYDDNNKIVKNRAYAYGTKDGTYEKRNLNYSTVGPTSLFTNAEDLSKWVLNFEHPTVGDAELLREFNKVSTLDNQQPAILSVIDEETIYHAKGQFKRNYKGHTLYNHTGSDAGFKSYLVRFPEDQLSIILLSNDENFASLKTGLEIAEFYLSDQFKKRPPKPEAVKNSEDQPKSIVRSTDLKDFTGKFQNDELSSLFTLKITEGKLIMTHPRLSDIGLTEAGQDRFTGEITFPVTINFARNTNGIVTELRITNFGATDVIFQKIN
jgi:CubicO group peptidase (beta-lactamase class C family)